MASPPLVLLALSSALAASPGEVVLSGGRWSELRPPEAPAVEQPGLVGASSREVLLEPTADGDLRVRSTWRVEVASRTPVELVLSSAALHGATLTVDGRPAAATATDRGLVWAGTPGRPFVLALTGTLPAGGHPERAVLDLLPAGSGTVELPAGWGVAEARAVAPGRFAGAPARLTLAPAERRAPRGRLVLGEIGLGLTFGEADLLVRGRLRWRVASGSLDRVVFVLPGAGEDLQVSGADVATWSREGDRVVVDLADEERGLVDLRFSFSARLPTGEEAPVAVPAVALEDVFRATTSLELARDGTLDLVPHLAGLEPVPLAQVPTWGEGLVEGTPTAAWSGAAAGGTVEVLRFVPADSPATLVDVASITAALTDDGHVLMRAHYAVRNDRGNVLRVTPPPGLVPVAARVGGEAVTVARDGDAWLVPLRKSVESVRGLLSFGVEIGFLGTDEAWTRRERRSFPLPRVDAEVAATRVTLHLPPGYASRARTGEHEVVDAFTEGGGVTYGFAVGDVRAAQADELFQAAVGAWMDNDFDAAQEHLDELEALGGDNADVAGLQGNLDVVAGKQEASDEAVNRRILDQARARAEDDRQKQQEALLEAEEETRKGDYGKANEALDEALELSDKLGKLSNAEDVSQQALGEDLKQKVSENAKRERQQAAFGATGTAAPREEPPPPPPPPEQPLDGPVFDREDTASVVLGGEAGTETSPVNPEPSPVEVDEPTTTIEWSAALPGVASRAHHGSAGGGREPAAPKSSAVDASSTTQGQVVSKEFLKNVPTGRSYQQAVTPPSGELAVTASRASLVVPTEGEAVLYQHLLLPAGADLAVRVDARRSRRNP